MWRSKNDNAEWTDELLIQRFQSGDESAFTVLLYRHQEVIQRVCMRLLLSQTDAQDAAQEIALKLYGAIASFQPQAKFTTWLYRISVNHCLNVLRTRKRKRWLLLFNDEKRPVEKIADEQGDPAQNFEQQERIQQVRRALAGLPEDQRVAVILHRYEGLSYEEIAEATQSSASAVESRLHRAKKNLYQSLSDYMEN